MRAVTAYGIREVCSYSSTSFFALGSRSRWVARFTANNKITNRLIIARLV